MTSSFHSERTFPIKLDKFEKRNSAHTSQFYLHFFSLIYMYGKGKDFYTKK